MIGSKTILKNGTETITTLLKALKMNDKIKKVAGSHTNVTGLSASFASLVSLLVCKKFDLDMEIYLIPLTGFIATVGGGLADFIKKAGNAIIKKLG